MKLTRLRKLLRRHPSPVVEQATQAPDERRTL